MQGSPLLEMTGTQDSLIALSFDIHGSPDIKVASDSKEMNRMRGDVRLVR
jgi:hypothetical protein